MSVDVTATAPVSAEDRAALRSAVAELLAERCTEDDVRRVMATPEGYDAALWSQLAGELGVAGLAVPAELGGAGASFEEVAVVFEELGRALCPSPYLSTTLALAALLAGADERVRAEHVPPLASGELLAAVTVEQPVLGAGPAASVTATADGVLHGVAAHVLDGHVAALFVVVADAPDGTGVFIVEPGEAGLTATPLKTVDQTRRLAEVEFAGARGVRIGGRALLDRLLDVAAVALASEQVGGAGAAMASAISYAQVRTQFGRPIGSFQAVKHKCADLFLAIESGKAAARRAAEEVALDGAERSVLASIAKAWCSDTYVTAAADNLQIHGGVGFTWEHSAHLHLRRAKTDDVLFGDARHHRARLADLLGV